MRISLLLFACMLVLATAAHAQPATIDRSTPEAVAQRYFEAMKADRTSEIIALTHPAVLDNFKAQLMPALERSAKAKTKSGGETFRYLGGGRKIETIRAMSSADFVTMVLDTMMDMMGDELPFQVNGTPLGHVMEGSDIAHVVYRFKIEADGAPPLASMYQDAAVITMRRSGESWYLNAPRELQAIVFAFTGGHGSIVPSDEE